MKIVYLFLIVVFLTAFLIPFSFAKDLDIDKTDKGSVVIAEIDNPAVFDFNFDNPGDNDSLEIYSFLGVTFSPRGNFDIPNGKSIIEVKAYPSKEVRKNFGNYKFEYQIKSNNYGIIKDSLSIKIVPLKDSLSIKANPIRLNDKNLLIEVKNTQNTNLENLKIKFDSAFFGIESLVSLKPFESKNVSIVLDQSKFSSLAAGQYIISSKIDYGEGDVILDGTIEYVESESIVLSKKSEGLIIRKKNLTKENAGNVPVVVQIEMTQDILSRLFTIHSFEPREVNRKGLLVNYIWEKSISPGESFSVSSTTNYTFPFIIIILIISVVVFVRIYNSTSLALTKRVSFVRTKGGEFALKVRVNVKAKKFVENIQIVDKLPGMTHLYEKFGIKPDKIDSATRRLFWNIKYLNAGEERVYSYIIYSKMKVVGRFELPSAAALFEREGRSQEVFSNRTYFVSETAGSEE